MRVGQKGTLTRVWGLRGRRAVRRRDLRFSSAYLFGAVCPERGTGAALVLPRVSLWATNQHLAEISQHVAPDAHAALVLDRAGWHSEPGLVVPANITLVALPPSSPALNPADALWPEMRPRFFALPVFTDYDATVDACCAPWNRAQLQGPCRREGVCWWFRTSYLSVYSASPCWSQVIACSNSPSAVETSTR